MRLLSTTIKAGQYKSIYENKGALEELIRGIVVPNVQLRGQYYFLFSEKTFFNILPSSEHDVEQFEDDPLEFIRMDLSLPISTTGTASFSSSGGGDGTSRRQAAADVVRALVVSGYEAQVTEIVSSWVNLGLQVKNFPFCIMYLLIMLQEYAKNPSENWKSKDSAIFLISAVAIRGVTSQVCTEFTYPAEYTNY